MADGHPGSELLERFLADALSPSERRAVVRHLLTGCPECTAVTRRLWTAAGGLDLARPRQRRRSAGPPSATGAVPHPSSYRGVFERVAERGLERQREIAAEREEAPRLAAYLLSFPMAERRALAGSEPGLASSALASLLLERSEREAAADAPAAADGISAIELAELALAVAERLDSRGCGAWVVRDLVLRAWTAAGEARRRAGDLSGAGRALAAAEAIRGAGVESGDAEDPAGESVPALRSLAGRIAMAEERTAEAEAGFLAARSGFLALGAGRDAALVSLDLALLYLREGRSRELRRLAGELYPIFAACDMRHEAIFSLLVFRRAVESETVSAELLLEIARYLAGFAAGRRARRPAG